MKTFILPDTNIFIRFFLKDNKDQFDKAIELFKNAEAGKGDIFLDEIIVAEIIWLLSTYYHKKKGEIVEKLLSLTSVRWIKNPRKKTIIQALKTYKTTNLSYIDCWILCVSKRKSIHLRTFDKNLLKAT